MVKAAEAAYSQTIEKRVADILVVLELKDPAKTARVHDLLVAQYRALRDELPEQAPDLRPAERCIVGALLAAMLAISVWPAGIGKHSFACVNQAQTASIQDNAPAQIGLACVSATNVVATSPGANP